MKQLTIQIPDNKFQFILNLLGRFSFVKIEPTAEGKHFVISEHQKSLVDEELRKISTDQSYLLDWDEVKDTLISV